MSFQLITSHLQSWQNRKEWFFNREHTDTYELWYEGRYKRAEVWQKKIIGSLVAKDERVKTLLEFGCGTTRFTRWWKEIGITASGGDISPFMLGQGRRLFDGDGAGRFTSYALQRQHVRCRSFHHYVRILSRSYSGNTRSRARKSPWNCFRNDEPEFTQSSAKTDSTILWKEPLLCNSNFLHAR